jgi:hypothetical protein
MLTVSTFTPDPVRDRPGTPFGIILESRSSCSAFRGVGQPSGSSTRARSQIPAALGGWLQDWRFKVVRIVGFCSLGQIKELHSARDR